MRTKTADHRIPAEAAAVASARRFTESCLSDWDLDDLVDTMNLLVTEVVTNAVVHGGTAAKLRLILKGRRLRGEVHDGSSTEPRVKDYSNTATTGRGMQIVEALADRWGSLPAEGGKVVWFELDAAEQTSRPGRRQAQTASTVAAGQAGSTGMAARPGRGGGPQSLLRMGVRA